MLLKFAYEDFITDRKFKNTTVVNIKNYQRLLLPFVEYCIAKGAINVEQVTHSHLKEYLLLWRHSDMTTTMRYEAMWGSELREENDKYNPLNNLDIWR